ncbi:MAG: hypothetical protein A3E80_00085 [Chlamydiae bacterium RIFCSPHIGHO2_12_FULL_49_9]|nr:MAG: hypothetical protein A3E80_00085 [Chlamydiae bacterium RIFCSPHIGHO2_12_FULL_49_9]
MDAHNRSYTRRSASATFSFVSFALMGFSLVRFSRLTTASSFVSLMTLMGFASAMASLRSFFSSFSHVHFLLDVQEV